MTEMKLAMTVSVGRYSRQLRTSQLVSQQE